MNHIFVLLFFIGRAVAAAVSMSAASPSYPTHAQKAPYPNPSLSIRSNLSYSRVALVLSFMDNSWVISRTYLTWACFLKKVHLIYDSNLSFWGKKFEKKLLSLRNFWRMQCTNYSSEIWLEHLIFLGAVKSVNWLGLSDIRHLQNQLWW